MLVKNTRSLIRLVARHRPDLPIWEAFESKDEFKLEIRELDRARDLLHHNFA
jgi:hypothetical protein